jgi:hypothetical protein
MRRFVPAVNCSPSIVCNEMFEVISNGESVNCSFRSELCCFCDELSCGESFNPKSVEGLNLHVSKPFLKTKLDSKFMFSFSFYDDRSLIKK